MDKLARVESWRGGGFIVVMGKINLTDPTTEGHANEMCSKINAASDARLLDYKRRVVEAVKGVPQDGAGWVCVPDAIAAVEGVPLG